MAFEWMRVYLKPAKWERQFALQEAKQTAMGKTWMES